MIEAIRQIIPASGWTAQFLGTDPNDGTPPTTIYIPIAMWGLCPNEIIGLAFDHHGDFADVRQHFAGSEMNFEGFEFAYEDV